MPLPKTGGLPVIAAVKGNYFFFFAAWGAWVPFLVPYLKNVCRFSDREIGVLLAIIPLVAFGAQPFWSWVADRLGRPAGVAAPLTIAVAFLFPLAVACKSVWAIGAVFFVYAIFAAPLVSLGDSIAFAVLGDEHRPRYASLRIWGSIGFTLSAAGCGALFDWIGERFLFAVFSFCMIISASLAWYIDSMHIKTQRTAPVSIRLLYTDRRLLTVTGIMLLLFTANQMALTFIGIYAMKLGATNAGVGWIWTMSAGAEVLLLPFAPMLVRRIGVRRMILIGMASVAVRCVPLAVCTQWWQILAITSLNCLVFVMCYVGGITFIDMVTPAHLRASGQGMFGMIVMNGSYMAGNLLAGVVLEAFGFTRLYLISAALAAISVALMLALVKDPRQQERIFTAATPLR